MIGLEGKHNGYDGGDANKLWEANNLTELREYVIGDVRITHGIYERAKEVGLF